MDVGRRPEHRPQLPGGPRAGQDIGPAPEAVAGFRAVGAGPLADVVAEAMAFFGEPYPRDQADRLDRPNQVPGESREEWDPFEALDDRFFAWRHARKDRWEKPSMR